MTTLSLIEARPDPRDFPPPGMDHPIAETPTVIGEWQCLIWEAGKAGTDIAALCESLDLFVTDGNAPDPIHAALCGWEALSAPVAAPVSMVALMLPREPVAPPVWRPEPLVWCCSTGHPPHVPDAPAPIPLPASGVLLILAITALWRFLK